MLTMYPCLWTISYTIPCHRISQQLDSTDKTSKKNEQLISILLPERRVDQTVYPKSSCLR